MNHPGTALPGTLERAITRVAAALFRVLLRQGFSYTAFDALARRVYVQVALAEFGIPGKKPTASRASILSGLTRKEVQRLIEEAEQPEAAPGGARDAAAVAGPERHNRAGRVLSAWAREADFLDAAGRPRRLAMQEGPASFAELVRRYSGDMPVRAVLDELVRLGAVRRTEGGEVEYVQQMFIGRRSAADKLDLLGTDVADLITTIDHNVAQGDADPRFQRKVMYRGMPASVVPAFRALAAEQGMATLRALDAWLAARAAEGREAGEGTTESTTGAAAEAQVRLGLGIYYFEETQAAPAPATAKPGKRKS